MPRKRGVNGTGTVRLRKDGRWEARLPNSKKARYFRRQSDAQEWLTAACAEINDGTYIATSAITVADWLSRWLDSFVDAKKDSTYAYYEQAVRLRINPYIGKIKLQDLRQYHIQDLIKELNKRYAAKTVRNTIGLLHCALKKAIKGKLISENPCEELDFAEVPRPKYTIMTHSQLGEFLAEIESSDIKNELVLLLMTGLRKGELAGLTWDCVDFEKKELHIYQQYIYSKKKHLYQFQSLKNKKERMVALPEAAVDALLDQKATQEEMALAAGSLWQNDEGFVFTKENGRPMSATTFHKHYKKICEKIGLGKMRVHDLRHNFATISLDIGVDIKTVQETLGHASASFTLKQYADSTMEMRHAAASAINSFLANPTAGKAD